MIGIVISDKFLTIGVWSEENNETKLHNVKQIEYTEPINDIVYNEGELSSVLGIALRRSCDLIPFSGEDIAVAISDEFLYHDLIETEVDLAREDYWDYALWKENQRERPEKQKVSIYGQIYLPDEVNIHTVVCPSALVRTVKLSISELGGNPFWMGPFSSVIIDAGWMALSRDRGTSSQKIDYGYGQVCCESGEIIKDVIVTNVQQEHGIIQVRKGSNAKLPNFKTGEVLRILPNHACATAAAHSSYYVINNKNKVTEVWNRFNGW